MTDIKEALDSIQKSIEKRKGGKVTNSPRKLEGRSLGDVKIQSVEWLWTGWIPKGYITLLAGETGAGKSTVLADITARVTTGAPWPGADKSVWRSAERVLWMGSEDSTEEMTVPRLIACKANTHNIFEIQGALQDGKRTTFSMQEDLAGVRDWLIGAIQEGFPFAMLVIDPVTSYLPGNRLRKVDLNDAGQLRSILEPWLVLAQEFNIAIVCVTHFAKDTNRTMLHRVLGSSAFAQTCRSLCTVVNQKFEDFEEQDPHAKVLMQVKTNLPEHPGGAWKFKTERMEVGVDHRNGKVVYATRPIWEVIDAALTPDNVVGKSHGPKSQFALPFAIWLQGFFAQRKAEWLKTSIVMEAALAEKVVSKNWWNEKSSEFLDKENVDGEWRCKIKLP